MRYATVPVKRSMVNCSAGTSPEGHKGGGDSNLEHAGQFQQLRLSRGLSAAIHLACVFTTCRANECVKNTENRCVNRTRNSHNDDAALAHLVLW